MVKVSDVCRHVRSKNAGPFWVTIDLFFDGPENFARYGTSESLGPPVPDPRRTTPSTDAKYVVDGVVSKF
jgi:hypothetical protein